jgi:general secretion pathway protein M
MSGLPNGLKGKALALALCVGIIAALYLGVVAPLVAHYGERASRLEDTVALTARLQLAAAETPSLNRTLDGLRQRSDLTELILPGTSDAVAAANLQATLAALAAKVGTGIASTEILTPQAQDPFRRIGLRINLTGDLTMLTNLLRGIDEARPPLFVDRLDLRSSAGTAPASGNAPPILAVTMDLHGFRQ